jgi:hypothetical protein
VTTETNLSVFQEAELTLDEPKLEPMMIEDEVASAGSTSAE